MYSLTLLLVLLLTVAPGPGTSLPTFDLTAPVTESLPVSNSVTGIFLQAGEYQEFAVYCHTDLRIDVRTTGEVGDLDLYTSKDSEFPASPAAPWVYSCRGYTASSNEECNNISLMEDEVLYIRMVAYTSFTGASLTATIRPEPELSANFDAILPTTKTSAKFKLPKGTYLDFWVYASVDQTVDVRTTVDGDLDLYTSQPDYSQDFKFPASPAIPATYACVSYVESAQCTGIVMRYREYLYIRVYAFADVTAASVTVSFSSLSSPALQVEAGEVMFKEPIHQGYGHRQHKGEEPQGQPEVIPGTWEAWKPKEELLWSYFGAGYMLALFTVAVVCCAINIMRRKAAQKFTPYTSVTTEANQVAEI